MARTCPACAEALPPEAKSCLHCGESATGEFRGGGPPPAPAKSGLPIALIVVIVALTGPVGVDAAEQRWCAYA